MLRHISWGSFLTILGGIALLYYAAVAVIFYKKHLIAWVKKRFLPVIALSLPICRVQAQNADGNNGINQANTLIRSYFQTGTQLMYAIGALVGLVGAIRVFVLWNSGHREEMNRAAAGWFGSCIFLVVVALIIQSFFGL